MAKLNSTILIMKRISALYGFGEGTKNRPIFLTGDFNSRPGSTVYKTFVGEENSNNPLLLNDSKEGDSGIAGFCTVAKSKFFHMRMLIIM